MYVCTYTHTYIHLCHRHEVVILPLECIRMYLNQLHTDIRTYVRTGGFFHTCTYVRIVLQDVRIMHHLLQCIPLGHSNTTHTTPTHNTNEDSGRGVIYIDHQNITPQYTSEGTDELTLARNVTLLLLAMSLHSNKGYAHVTCV